MPGYDWVRPFLIRHKKRIGRRRVALINRARAAVSTNDMEKYFDELKITLDSIPPSHLFNYDETNVQDNPGSSELLFRRG